MFNFFVDIIKKQFGDNSVYMLPFDVNISNDTLFDDFKNNDIEVNKIIFALNNVPDIIHQLLFTENYICNQYYFITLKMNPSKIINVHHNLSNITNDLIDDKIRYIYIRINIITDTQMHHVNCIVIDKKNKYILLFEPQVSFVYDPNIILSLLDAFIELKSYKTIFPSDVGYNMFNKLQRYDTYCQTYVLFIFVLIVYNQHIHYKDFSKLFNTNITTETIGYFLFYIYKILKNSNCSICTQPVLWNYPCNINNIIKTIDLYFNKNINKNNIDVQNITVIDQDDFTVVELI